MSPLTEAPPAPPLCRNPPHRHPPIILSGYSSMSPPLSLSDNSSMPPPIRHSVGSSRSHDISFRIRRSRGKKKRAEEDHGNLWGLCIYRNMIVFNSIPRDLNMISNSTHLT